MRIVPRDPATCVGVSCFEITAELETEGWRLSGGLTDRALVHREPVRVDEDLVVAPRSEVIGVASA